MIAAAIFDMDGLLIDSEPFWHKAHIQTVQTYGHELSAEDVRLKAGHKTIEIAQNWIERFELDVTADDLCVQIVDRVIVLIEEDGRTLPGVYEALELFARHDVPMAIASSASPEVIDAVIQKLELSKYILFAYSAVHESKGKPDPAVFLTTAKKLGVEPADCLVFEDALSGIKAAKSAGMKCIAVPEKINSNKREFIDESDLILHSLRELDWDVVKALFEIGKF
ncbi:MAG TPA: HAD-IA family hydrolase [Candidatus Saccharimonadales bacterium]|jgi:sugar-phosphatase